MKSPELKIGTHILLEFCKGDSKQLNDHDHLCGVLRSAATQAKMHIIKESSHRFEPQGVTAILLIAESHISIHTWPEHKSCAVDIYCCKSKEKAMQAAEYIKGQIAGTVTERVIDRVLA